MWLKKGPRARAEDGASGYSLWCRSWAGEDVALSVKAKPEKAHQGQEPSPPGGGERRVTAHCLRHHGGESTEEGWHELPGLHSPLGLSGYDQGCLLAL